MIYVGVDIAKRKFDVCFDAHQIQKAHQKKKFATFENTQEGIWSCTMDTEYYNVLANSHHYGNKVQKKSHICDTQKNDLTPN